MVCLELMRCKRYLCETLRDGHARWLSKVRRSTQCSQKRCGYTDGPITYSDVLFLADQSDSFTETLRIRSLRNLDIQLECQVQVCTPVTPTTAIL